LAAINFNYGNNCRRDVGARLLLLLLLVVVIVVVAFAVAVFAARLV